MPTAASEKRDSTAPHRSSGNKENVQPSHHAAASRRSAQGGSRNDGKSKKQDDEYTESSDESDVPHPSRSPVVRSRSYEALVQLEGILEARHQQLMKDGILEPPTSAAATGNGDTGDNDDDDDDETAAPKMVMTDIQEEIRKMHRSLRQQRRADAENYAVCAYALVLTASLSLPHGAKLTDSLLHAIEWTPDREKFRVAIRE